jgi:hypothetical protein
MRSDSTASRAEVRTLMSELREGEATWVCPWAWCKRNGGEEWCDKCELRVALAASQEKERQLREALHRIAHSGGGTFETVDGLRMNALDALDFIQTNGG